MARLKDFTTDSTIASKEVHESFIKEKTKTVEKHRADNGKCSDNTLIENITENSQSAEFCGVGAHHQNGVAERANRSLTGKARTVLMHARRKWTSAIFACFWQMTFSHGAFVSNHSTFDDEGICPMGKLSGNYIDLDLSSMHTFG